MGERERRERKRKKLRERMRDRDKQRERERERELRTEKGRDTVSDRRNGGKGIQGIENQKLRTRN